MKLSNIQSWLNLDGLPDMSFQDVVEVPLCALLSTNNTFAGEINCINMPYAGKVEVKITTIQ